MQTQDIEGLWTASSGAQEDVEQQVTALLAPSFYGAVSLASAAKLRRAAHLAFLRPALNSLPQALTSLDASRLWIIYWVTHARALLHDHVDEATGSRIARFLSRCQASTGGFCGGPGHFPHIAATYAAINALVTIGTTEALSVINVSTLRNFLYSLRTPEGAFRMHPDGEIDVRGAYCSLSVARLCGIEDPVLFQGTATWIASCQTYEGGLGGEPGMEAHGGYAFCALAAMYLLGEVDKLDLDRLLHWLVHRQMSLEGGFQGRTNKLVDSCYSFWQGATFPLLHEILVQKGRRAPSQLLCNGSALQKYGLICCQHENGGCIDKPGAKRDFYHTCYCLSGLSAVQNFFGEAPLGGETDRLAKADLVHNIVVDKVANAYRFFQQEIVTLQDCK